MEDELAIQDIPPAAELLKRLSVVETESRIKVDALEKQVSSLKVELEALKLLPNSPVKQLPCFEAFKKEDGRIILSTAIKSTEQWYKTSYLVPHEPIRRDIFEVDFLLKHHVRADEPWKLVNFFTWYEDRFVPIVHAHHEGEEQIFFPEIVKRCPLPDKTSADHKVLLNLLDEISALGKSFRENGGDATNIVASTKTLPLLVAKWSELVTMMLPHLEEEENQMLSMIKDVFKKEEFDKLIGKVIKHEGLSGAKLVLPSIIESMDMWGTPDIQQDFRKQLPPPIKFLLNYFWLKSYAKYHRGALSSLRAGSEKTLIKEKSWF